MSLYYTHDNDIKLYNGDCFEILKTIDDESIDLIFSDPPYFLSNNGITCKSGKMESVNKADWDKAVSVDEMHNFNLRWISECRKKLKDNGTIFISGTYHNIYSIGFCLQQLGFKILNDIAWFKVNPPPNLSCRYFTHATETIIWAKKNPKAKHKFNYQAMRNINDPAVNKQMLSLWKITPPKKDEKKYGKHPTQKPIALLNRIVEASTNEGDIVLDPFLGSGTTAVACVNYKRKFIGIELDVNYLEIAKLRVNDALNIK